GRGPPSAWSSSASRPGRPCLRTCEVRRDGRPGYPPRADWPDARNEPLMRWEPRWDQATTAEVEAEPGLAPARRARPAPEAPGHRARGDPGGGLEVVPRGGGCRGTIPGVSGGPGQALAGSPAAPAVPEARPC